MNAFRLAIVASLLVVAGCGRRRVAPPTSTGLAGMVVAEGAEGVGVAGAEAVLQVDPDGKRVPLVKGITGADGRFFLPNVPDGTYWLDVRSSRLVERITRVTLVGATGRELRRLVLEKSRTLEGRVVDLQDGPVPLAHVLVFVGGGTEGLPLKKVAETRADLEGRFHLADLGRGPYRVLIEAPGLGAAEIPDAVITADTVRIRIDAQTGKVSGTVLERGRPVPGAELWLYGELLADAQQKAADESGRFVFAGLGPGRYAVVGRLGHRVSRPVLLVVDEGLRPPAPVDLALESGEVQTGQVHDDQGRSVVGARVSISEIRPGLFPLTTALEVTRDGSFTSPALSPGSYRFGVQAPGFVPSRETRIEIAVGKRPALLSLPMSREAKVRGRVVARTGAPLLATVRLLRPGFDQLAILTRALPPAAEAAAMAPSPRFDAAARVLGTRSDREGRFTFEAVAAGPFRVEILAEGHPPWRSGILSLSPGGDSDQGNVVVP